ncbi:hypothetical protein [Eubacterium sp. LMAG:50]|uniref:hypothetical protein n=1 Tax=Eubacterium sp. LMAG:50 TaxID=1969563 RepID=UPI0025BEAB4C|nr:hypothetical protein [Eubacterium sp. LMAG:50]
MVVIKNYFTWRKILVFIAMIVVATLIPIFINESYKRNTGYVTLWGAKEMLQFYGSVLGSIVAVYGVYITLDYNTYQNKQNYIRQINPMLSSDRDLVLNPKIFSEIQGKTFFIEINNEFEIKISKSMTNTLIDMIDVYSKASDGNNELLDKASEYMEHICMIDYVLENMGQGNAVNIEMKINEKNCMAPFGLASGEKITFKFIIDYRGFGKSKKNEINLNYEYTNTYEEPTYTQQEKFQLRKKNNKIYIAMGREDFMSKRTVN